MPLSGTHETAGRMSAGSIEGPFLATSAKKATRTVSKTHVARRCQHTRTIVFVRPAVTASPSRLTGREGHVFAADHLDPRARSEAAVRLVDVDVLPPDSFPEHQLLGDVVATVAHVDVGRVNEKRARPREEVDPAVRSRADKARFERRMLWQVGDEQVGLYPDGALRLRVEVEGRVDVRSPLRQLDGESRPPFRFADDFDFDGRLARDRRRQELGRKVRGIVVRRGATRLPPEGGIDEDVDEDAAVRRAPDAPFRRDVDVKHFDRPFGERRRRARVSDKPRSRRRSLPSAITSFNVSRGCVRRSCASLPRLIVSCL